jgi:hypothetical protein
LTGQHVVDSLDARHLLAPLYAVFVFNLHERSAKRVVSLLNIFLGSRRLRFTVAKVLETTAGHRAVSSREPISLGFGHITSSFPLGILPFLA